MSLEDLTGSGKFISDLIATNPVGSTDPKSEGDDHLRGIKNVLKNSLPNITGAITATQAELNSLAGRQAFIDIFLKAATEGAARTAIKADMAPTTVQLFDQSAAPTFWTKLTTLDDYGIKIVSGTGGVSSGSASYSSRLVSTFVTATELHTLTAGQSGLPAHAHVIAVGTANLANGAGAFGPGSTGSTLSAQVPAQNASQGHQHSLNLTLDVQTRHVIRAQKN